MIATLEPAASGNYAHSCGAPYLADPDFALEEPGARAQVDRWWPLLAGIEAAPNKEAARFAVCRQASEKEGNVRKLYYAWMKSGRDWRELIDRREYPDPRAAVLPPLFEQHIRKVYDAQKGRDLTGAQTRRKLMEQLAAWERDPLNTALAIPGYSEPPRRNSFLGYPDGWSKWSINRRLPNKYQRALRKQGPKMASQFLPSVHTTRTALQIGQVIYFDDQDHDNYVNVTGINQKTLRPQSFNAIEALTGFAFEPGLKPQIWDAKEGKVRKLDQLDFFWYVMMILTRYGYNAECKTCLIFEHGTANVDKREQSKWEDHFDVMIRKVTGDNVWVDRSGIFSAPAFRELLFEGKPTGNFRFKALIESWFNLLRNYSAGLPAPTGRNRDRAPEESYGLVMANEKMLKLIDTLPRERFLALQREVLEWEDYARAHLHIVRAVNRRDDHAMEGWHKLGFTGQRYRLGIDQPWIDEKQWLLIPGETREVYRHIVTQPGYFDSYKLSPEQAYESLSHKLTKLPMWQIPLLAPPRAWEPVTVRPNLEMHVRRELIDPDPLRFYARVRTPHGHEVHLERGRTYLRLLNIFDPSQLWIAEAEGSRKGAFIGVADAILASGKLDQEGILRQVGTVAHIRSIESKDAQIAAESEMSRRLAMREHNQNVLGGNTAADREERDRLREEAAPMSDFLPDEAAKETPGPRPLSPADFLP
jgi:hypothetical protein